MLIGELSHERHIYVWQTTYGTYLFALIQHSKTLSKVFYLPFYIRLEDIPRFLAIFDELTDSRTARGLS